MTHDPHRRIRDAIAAHFAGTGGPKTEQEMRAHLPVCADCHAHYEQHLLFASLDPAGLSSETRLARGLGVRPARAPGSPLLTFGGLGLATAAVAALVIFYLPGTYWPGAARWRTAPHAPGAAAVPPRAEVATRGAPFGVAAARTPEVQVYRIYTGRRGSATSEMAGDFVYAGDELAFAYRNPGGRARLLIFAVDEHGHVYWYHPGWSDLGENPTAVPISTEPGLHELRAAVLHKFDGERIMIHALFTDRELSVRQVEAAIAAVSSRDRAAGGPRALEPLALPGATDVVRPLRVVR